MLFVGVNIPDNKKIKIALTHLYGIGLFSALKILKIANVNPEIKAKELNNQEISRLKEIIEKNYRIEGELRREVQGNIKRLKEISSYRGSRHLRRLPVRGQRTKTNSRTSRGSGGQRRKTAGSGKRKMEKT